MPAIGITGGVASGKSALTALLAELVPALSFSADQCARTLLQEDEQIRREVASAFGPATFKGDGQLDRAVLRERVFANAEDRRRLEAVLHPRVRAAWQAWLQEQLQNRPQAVLLVEIPLLYETGAATFFDRTIVVACRPETQLHRLTARRGLSIDLARQIVASQWDLQEKIRRSDHLIWNDGAMSCLQEQASLCSRLLRQQRQEQQRQSPQQA